MAEVQFHHVETGTIGAEAQIPEFQGATVSVTGDVRGPLSQALGVVNTSPLASMLGHSMARASATGDADVKLRLELPIATIEKSKVQGSVVLAFPNAISEPLGDGALAIRENDHVALNALLAHQQMVSRRRVCLQVAQVHEHSALVGVRIDKRFRAFLEGDSADEVRLLEAAGKVLVHCRGGLGRAGTVGCSSAATKAPAQFRVCIS
jgi:hypothetical protein